MKTLTVLFSTVLMLLIQSSSIDALCSLSNGTKAICNELEDVKFIETYNLESLKSIVIQNDLGAGLFSNLSSLKHLDLSGGKLKYIEPGTFGKLTDLKSLDIADNAIEHLDLGAFDGLTQLRSLNLRRNKFRQLPPGLIRLKNLRHLDVQSNPLQCNCPTLRVRDLLLKRGVKLSKKIVCVGPANVKNTSFLKPNTKLICNLEEQDREMQNDQPHEGSGEEDALDFYDEDEKSNELEATSEAPVEVETPVPVSTSTTASVESHVTDGSIGQQVTIDKSLDEEELYFESDDKHRKPSITTTQAPKEIKDALFYPVEGSGDEEGSGLDGSGAGPLPDYETEHEESHGSPSSTSSETLLDIIFSGWWPSTSKPVEKEEPEPDLEEEEFLDVSTRKTTEEPIPKVPVEEEHVTVAKVDTVGIAKPKGTPEPFEPVEDTKSGKVLANEETSVASGEVAEVSPAQQSKKGLGSYVVLAALLLILAVLIGFAAYKGDFCRKKRKRNDVEHGTELKDMRKSLLDGGNAPPPKVTSNGNAESVPLVENGHSQDDKETSCCRKESRPATESPKYTNGIHDSSEPVKPPRKIHDEIQRVQEVPRENASTPSSFLSKDDATSRSSPVDSLAMSKDTPSPYSQGSDEPPLSPGAQRVKIVLQDNPDSVPKTPILITRTMAGDNLVKTP